MKHIRREAHKSKKINYGLYIEARGNECELCHNSFPPEIYNLHHIKPELKKTGLGLNAWTNVRLPQTVAEADTCALLCANCHILEHIALRKGSSLLTKSKGV